MVTLISRGQPEPPPGYLRALRKGLHFVGRDLAGIAGIGVEVTDRHLFDFRFDLCLHARLPEYRKAGPLDLGRPHYSTQRFLRTAIWLVSFYQHVHDLVAALMPQYLSRRALFCLSPDVPEQAPPLLARPRLTATRAIDLDTFAVSIVMLSVHRRSLIHWG
jgi:hypothetical protein